MLIVYKKENASKAKCCSLVKPFLISAMPKIVKQTVHPMIEAMLCKTVKMNGKLNPV